MPDTKSPPKTVAVTIHDLSRDEALALAQFVKRSRFDTYREFAVDDDEALVMVSAVDKLREGRAAEGFSPR